MIVRIEWTELAGGDGSLLADDERARADRFRSAEDRRRFVAGRTWLRRRLGAAVGVSPASLRFEYGPAGKPALVGPRAVEFSLAHSADLAVLAVLAVGNGDAIGVDVERVRPGVYERDAAALILTGEDLAIIDAATDPDAAFLRHWTRKEAYAKVGGDGLERHLSDFSLGDHGVAANGAIEVQTVELGIPGVVCAVGTPPGTVIELAGRT